MSQCARCGLERVALGHKGCSAGESVSSDLACRDIELSNLRALLRSVTGKLEDTHDFLAPGASPAEVATARHLVAQILEVLS